MYREEERRSEYEAARTIDKANVFDDIMSVYLNRQEHWMTRARMIFDICRENVWLFRGN